MNTKKTPAKKASKAENDPCYNIEVVARDVSALLQNPHTPASLRKALLDYINDSIQIKDSEGESLLDRWIHHHETILAACTWAGLRDCNDPNFPKHVEQS